jgi:hypothetical protein
MVSEAELGVPIEIMTAATIVVSGTNPDKHNDGRHSASIDTGSDAEDGKESEFPSLDFDDLDFSEMGSMPMAKRMSVIKQNRKSTSEGSAMTETRTEKIETSFNSVVHNDNNNNDDVSDSEASDSGDDDDYQEDFGDFYFIGKNGDLESGLSLK